MFRSLLVFTFGLGLAWGVVQASEEGRGVLSQRPSAASGGAQVIFSGDFDGTPGLWASGLDGLNLRKVVPISNGGIAERAELVAGRPAGGVFGV